MGDSKIPQIPIKSPALSCKLGDIRFSDKSTKPLGGINPYCKQFDLIGSQFFNLLIEHARLKPISRILDLGCGTGRLAKQLVNFIEPKNYVGIDNNLYFLDYCRKAYPTLAFCHHDIRHEEFNAAGTLDILNSSLPVPDESFDIVACLGLFNHFQFEWIEHYIQLISKALKPNGILFCTAVLLNDFSITKINNKLTKRPFEFNYKTNISWHEFEDRPLLNVAVFEQPIRRIMMANKLLIKEPIRYGDWCNSINPLSGHDIIVARKNGWGV